MAEQIIIKKYSNRRLYDTSHKKYVTLDEIANLIKDGNEIKVLDSQTDEDITKVILIQVVLESEKNKVDILPTSFLHMLIKYGNRIAKDFFENYFLMMFQPYLSFQENMKKNLHWWQEIGWVPPGMKFPLNPEMKNMFPFHSVEPEKQYDGDQGGELGSAFASSQLMEIELLREKIKQLEEKVQTINPKRVGRKEKGVSSKLDK
ncbi:MAG: polyhydroxyalkanoate synthesis regulator DNA-binding domain-containing protein [Thermodesulfobacteriota bacterium]